jgi:hypothetical protein
MPSGVYEGQLRVELVASTVISFVGSRFFKVTEYLPLGNSILANSILLATLVMVN